jgi:kumamolisin
VTVKVHRKEPLPEPVAGKPINRAELAKRYGANEKDLNTVAASLKRYGLNVVSQNATTRSIKVTGPVAAMEQAFGVQLLKVRHNDIVYRGRVGQVHIPAELAGIVTGVFGLDTRPMVKRRKPLRRDAASHSLPPPDQRPWYLPQELGEAYQFPAGDGAGQVVGILEFGGQYLAHDLQQFLQLAGMPSAVPEIVVKNVQPLPPQDRNDPGAIGETMLDIEIVAALCPKATINVYFSPWTEQGWLENLDAVLTDASTPPVVSVSYGLAEGDDIWTQTAIDEVNDSLKELANAGVTVCVATGDDGSDDQVADTSAHVSFPAASPYVLAVGGTMLTRSTGDEVVWFEGDGLRRDDGGSTGGGVSALNPRPSWQAAVPISPANPHQTAGRILPDVAANAAGSTGYFMVSQNTPQVSGGTSAATPLWASLLTRLRQAGKQFGFLPPLLYQSSPTSGGKSVGLVACRDITQGSNRSGNAPGYEAKTGFDAASGWGSPNGNYLQRYLP